MDSYTNTSASPSPSSAIPFDVVIRSALGGLYIYVYQYEERSRVHINRAPFLNPHHGLTSANVSNFLYRRVYPCVIHRGGLVLFSPYNHTHTHTQTHVPSLRAHIYIDIIWMKAIEETVWDTLSPILTNTFDNNNNNNKRTSTDFAVSQESRGWANTRISANFRV